MGIGHTQEDENASVRQPPSMDRCPLLCHPDRSRGICGSMDPSWKCFSRDSRGAAPSFFGPCTLRRTWGTRPGGYVWFCDNDRYGEAVRFAFWKVIWRAAMMPFPSWMVIDWLGVRFSSVSLWPLGQAMVKCIFRPGSGLPRPKVMGNSL